MGPLCAVVGGGFLLAGWFAPALIVPGIGILLAVALAARGVRGSLAGAALLVCLAVIAVFAVKDFLPPGPLAEAVAALGAPVGFHARQPNLPTGLGQLASLGLVVLILPVLRTCLADRRLALYWMRTVVVVTTGLAAAVLTHPAATADYGEAFHLGYVVSRNPASAAFALGAIFAAGLAVVAVRDGRSWEWPLAGAAAAVCVAAVAGLGSRGGLFALAVGGGWFVVRLGDRRIRGTVAALVVLGIGLLLLAPATVARLIDLRAEYRLELWAASMRALAQAPFAGFGSGGFQAGFALFGGLIPAEGMRVTHPDSSWVLMLVEWGPLGLIAVAGAGWCLLRNASAEGDQIDIVRVTAWAGVAAWATAAIGDIALHRPSLLVIGVPLLAIAFPSREALCPAGGGRHVGVMSAGLLALLFAGVSIWADYTHKRPDDPTQVDARLAGLLPLDPRVHHVLGLAALERGAPDEAASHFTLVAALEPANARAIHAYARALLPVRRDLALPLWRRLMVAARLTASSLLAAELAEPGSPDAVYWMRAIETRPELWVVPADSDLTGAQRCYERWRMAPESVRVRSPIGPVLGAIARWGTTGDLDAWLRTGPEVVVSRIASWGRLLRSRGRSDLAWLWLTRLLPAPPLVSGGIEPGLRARVLANPYDHVAAARLLNRTPATDEGLKLLDQLASRPGAPVWFRIRHAHALRERGLRDEALDVLLTAADALEKRR